MFDFSLYSSSGNFLWKLSMDCSFENENACDVSRTNQKFKMKSKNIRQEIQVIKQKKVKI
jgi:hypothetical protein